MATAPKLDRLSPEHLDVVRQCRCALNACRVNHYQVNKLHEETQHDIAVVARWTLERLCQALAAHRGETLCGNETLPELVEKAGFELRPDEKQALDRAHPLVHGIMADACEVAGAWRDTWKLAVECVEAVLCELGLDEDERLIEFY